jgi:predicted CXXCH cytochrome family protein
MYAQIEGRRQAVKRLIVIALGVATWLLLGATAAWADNGPHVSTAQGVGTDQLVQTDRCASCHRAHTSQGQMNLVNPQPQLCLTCHGTDGTGASTDVEDGIGYVGADGTPDATRDGASTVGALRGGGFKFALIGSANPTKETYQYNPTTLRARNQKIPVLAAGQDVTSIHDVYGAEGAKYTAWGNGVNGSGAGSSIALECGSCHDPHGNGNYRILKAIPDASGATTGVAIPDQPQKVYVTSDYWQTGATGVPLVAGGVTAPDGFIQNIASWCTTCHTRYLAPSQSYKTDSGDPIFKYRHRSDNVSKVGGANCITCHVAHGSNADMGGTYSSQVKLPDGTDAPAGDSRLLRVDNRGICLMCHNV